jgi:hypothetical protein
MMKRIALLTAALMMSGSLAAHAASLPSPVMNSSPGLTEQDIKSGLENLGYTDVYDVEGTGRFYTARADYQGVWYPLQIDVATGEVTSLANRDFKYISVVSGVDNDHVVKEVERLGYGTVVVNKQEGAYTELEAQRYGQVTYLTIDTRTGQVIDHEQGYAWFVPVAVDKDMTQDEAAAHLQKMGYNNVQQLPHTGGMYTFEATQGGKEVSVFVDKESGEIHEIGQSVHN